MNSIIVYERKSEINIERLIIKSRGWPTWFKTF